MEDASDRFHRVDYLNRTMNPERAVNPKAKMQKNCQSELESKIYRDPKALDLAIQNQKTIATVNF